MLDWQGTAFVTRTMWVRLPPPALSDSGVAQVVERLPEEEKVAGSTPAAGTVEVWQGSLAVRQRTVNPLDVSSTLTPASVRR